MRPILPNVSSPRGAPMGRCNLIPVDRFTDRFKFYLRRLQWVDGDYDESGAYWGNVGDYVYWAAALNNTDEIVAQMFVRAHHREEAKVKVRGTFRHARFYR